MRQGGDAPTESDQADLARRIGAAWRELRRGAAMTRLRDHLFGHGADALDPGQFDTLEFLVQRGGCRMGQLASALRVDASTATRAVARLVADGLATRAPARDDARCVMVVPTSEGVERYGRIARHRREVLDLILERIAPGDRRALADLLELLVEAVDAFTTDHPPGVEPRDRT